MDKDTRNAIERATQKARKLLEVDFADQLEGDFDVHQSGEVAAKAGKHLSARQALARERVVAAIEHKRAAGMSAADAARDYLRDAAFTTLNRFVALKMLEARDLVQECITKGEQSAGYREFCGMAPGLPLLPDSAGYRLYIESIFDELSTEVKVLFDRRDSSSVLWPKRATFEQLLGILNASDLAGVWVEDETVGWVYQFFNGEDDRRAARYDDNGKPKAPRNSRELAVRNQFFTPRYVVQFLTDNTLGRIWYEMRGSHTVLTDRCEYMVRKRGEELAPRAKKDPRDLRVLDPACGSGHFLLYAFELLLAIYEEAHSDPESPKSEATGKSLADDYSSLDALKSALPRLVLAHNLHGVDIDPRCAQVAQLALWMRAQKAYRDFGIGRGTRSQIRRSNIVVAEPLVADDLVAGDFAARLGDPELGRVFSSLVNALSLAGDLGLLLRVEQLVARQPTQGQMGSLFAPPEERIRAALDQFAGEVLTAPNTRRRLFAEDATHGLALLGVAEKKFDTVLMNPPFGAGSSRAKRAFGTAYPKTKNDLYAAFVERGIELLTERGRIGAITSRTGFFFPRFQKWREQVIVPSAPPVLVADLGYGVLDSAMVEVAAYCLEKAEPQEAVFFRLVEAPEKAVALGECVSSVNEGGRSALVYRALMGEFRAVPGTPLSYWVAPEVRQVFATLPPFERDGRVARVGLQTNDDHRWLRTWWEAAPSEHEDFRLVPIAKGGANAPFYADLAIGLRWGKDGRSIKAWKSDQLEQGLITANNSKCWNESHYGRAGLTWPHRSATLAAAALPSGCVFGQSGKTAFAAEGQLASLLGFLNSDLATLLTRVMSDAVRIKFEVGLIQRLPLHPGILRHEELERLARRAWSLRRLADSVNEVSHAFLLPAELAEVRSGINLQAIGRELAEVQERVNAVVYGVYKLDPARVENLMALSSADADTDLDLDSDDDDAADQQPEEEEDTTQVTASQALLSWLVGCSFGRFDPRLAIKERSIPPEPDPFDALPSRSPGMRPEDEQVEDRVDILVDDVGRADDLAARILAIAERVKVDVPEGLRGWLAKEFFPLHIKMYSRSRRRAPIYWQIATPSASYSVWLYIHALSTDTFFRVQNEYVAPKLAHEERRLEALTMELRDGATAAQRKQLVKQETLVDELRSFLDEVKRVAPLWNPNLDDGVIINFAPLWRLVPQHKVWQKELRATWVALCDEKYDWAHLAMHLWPERVVPKCAKDRSLAIAHGLEDMFWIEGADGKWTARKKLAKSVDELVKERTSPAVKAALNILLEAPVASGKTTGRNSGGRRKATASAERGDA